MRAREENSQMNPGFIFFFCLCSALPSSAPPSTRIRLLGPAAIRRTSAGEFGNKCVRRLVAKSSAGRLRCVTAVCTGYGGAVGGTALIFVPRVGACMFGCRLTLPDSWDGAKGGQG